MKNCKNCGEPIDLDDYFDDWFHTGRADAPNDLLCDPTKPYGGRNFAEPIQEEEERNGN